MRMQAERLRHALVELRFDVIGRFALGETRPVADPQDMRVDCEGLLAEPSIQDDVGGLAPHTGEAD